jgi:hypothetical protein
VFGSGVAAAAVVEVMQNPSASAEPVAVAAAESMTEPG